MLEWRGVENTSVFGIDVVLELQSIAGGFPSATKMKENEMRLEQVLQEWRVTSPLPPRFREQVWQRIDRTAAAKISISEVLQVWFATAFARPAFAFAYVSVLLALGLALGFVQANRRSAEVSQQLEARYVQSIDPYQRIQ
jgi:hypothetical protein